MDLSFSLEDKHKDHFKCMCGPDCKQQLHGLVCVFINLLPLMIVHAFLCSLNICSAKPIWRLQRHRGLLMAIQKRGEQHIHPTRSILEEAHFHTSLISITIKSEGTGRIFVVIKMASAPHRVTLEVCVRVCVIRETGKYIGAEKWACFQLKPTKQNPLSGLARTW